MKKLISSLLLFAPMPALAHGDTESPNYHDSMMDWMGGGWGSFWMILGVAVVVLVIVVLVLLVAKLLKK